MENYYKNYSQYSIDYCNLLNIKFKTIDNINNDLEIADNIFYLNRIGNKSRLINNSDNMRNLIQIKIDTRYLVPNYFRYFLMSQFKLMDYAYRYGTCQQCIRISSLKQIVANCHNKSELLQYKLTLNNLIGV